MKDTNGRMKMKRSEAVLKIIYHLDLMVKDLEKRPDISDNIAETYADIILNSIEVLGMLPPLITPPKRFGGNEYDQDLSNYRWDKE